MAKSGGGGGRPPANRMKPAPQLPVNPDNDKKPKTGPNRPAPGIPVPRRKN